MRPEVVGKRKAVAKMMRESYDDLLPYLNRAEMPMFMIPKIRSLDINGFRIKDHGGPGMSNLECGAIAFELAKYDASISSFYMIHNGIGTAVISELGD